MRAKKLDLEKVVDIFHLNITIWFHCSTSFQYVCVYGKLWLCRCFFPFVSIWRYFLKGICQALTNLSGERPGSIQSADGSPFWNEVVPCRSLQCHCNFMATGSPAHLIIHNLLQISIYMRSFPWILSCDICRSKGGLARSQLKSLHLRASQVLDSLTSTVVHLKQFHIYMIHIRHMYIYTTHIRTYLTLLHALYMIVFDTYLNLKCSCFHTEYSFRIVWSWFIYLSCCRPVVHVFCC